MFKGSIVALVTPFKNGEVDYKTLEELVEFHIENKTHAIVSCGTTGESATLTHEEDVAVTKFVINVVNKRIPVIAGAGSNNYREALFLAESAKKNGADGTLIVTPYYNKPTQEGMFQHYKMLADNAKLPIILYNVPGRTGVNLLPETVLRLAEVPNIVALKDATGHILSAMAILCDKPDFTVLCGDDSLTMAMMAMGAKGVISVAANVIPKEMSELTEAMLHKDYAKAAAIHYKYLKLMDALFYESNPIPAKAALHMMGRISDELRLPMTKMSDAPKAKLEKIMKDLKLV